MMKMLTVGRLPRKAAAAKGAQNSPVKPEIETQLPISKYLVVVGMAYTTNGELVGVAIKRKVGSTIPLIVPMKLLGTRVQARAEEWLLENDFGAMLRDGPAK